MAANHSALRVTIGKTQTDIRFRIIESRNGVWLDDLPADVRVTTNAERWFISRDDDDQLLSDKMIGVRRPLMNRDPGTDEIVLVFDPTDARHIRALEEATMAYLSRCLTGASKVPGAVRWEVVEDESGIPRLA